MLRWTLLVPVKNVARAKSRLQPPPGTRRSDLAVAFARDTLRAAASLPEVDVVLVTGDASVRDLLRDYAERTVDDAPVGLNAALAYAASLCAGGPLAALTADLPALQPSSLRRALAGAAATAYAVVPDASGVGTTMLAAAQPALFRPRFGAGSRQAHERDGARVLDAAADLRRDVDTAEDLQTAHELGLGPATSGLLVTAAAAFSCGQAG